MRQPSRRDVIGAALAAPIALRAQLPQQILPQQPPEYWGRWDGPYYVMPVVAIHLHVLPNGKVLAWGRMEQQPHNAYLLDPVSLTASPLPLTAENIFCSGHSFLPDGLL